MLTAGATDVPEERGGGDQGGDTEPLPGHEEHDRNRSHSHRVEIVRQQGSPRGGSVSSLKSVGRRIICPVMIDIAHLENREIVFKLPGMAKAVSGKVVKVDKEHKGLWIMGGDLVKALSEFGFPKGLQKPALFVPLNSLEWLMADSEYDGAP